MLDGAVDCGEGIRRGANGGRLRETESLSTNRVDHDASELRNREEHLAVVRVIADLIDGAAPDIGRADRGGGRASHEEKRVAKFGAIGEELFSSTFVATNVVDGDGQHSNTFRSGGRFGCEDEGIGQ